MDLTVPATLSRLAVALSESLPDDVQSVSYNASTDYMQGVCVFVRGGYATTVMADDPVWAYRIQHDATQVICLADVWTDLPTDETTTLLDVLTRITTDLYPLIDALHLS